MLWGFTKNPGNIPYVDFDEGSKTALGFEIGSWQQKLWLWRSPNVYPQVFWQGLLSCLVTCLGTRRVLVTWSVHFAVRSGETAVCRHQHAKDAPIGWLTCSLTLKITWVPKTTPCGGFPNITHDPHTSLKRSMQIMCGAMYVMQQFVCHPT